MKVPDTRAMVLASTLCGIKYVKTTWVGSIANTDMLCVPKVKIKAAIKASPIPTLIFSLKVCSNMSVVIKRNRAMEARTNFQTSVRARNQL